MTYTGRGDEGRTDLCSGERVSKDSATIEACGTVDELESVIGVCEAHSGKDLSEIQNELHILEAELSNREPEVLISSENIERLEERCDRFQREIPPLRSFVLAGGSVAASHLDHARAVARRMERRIVEVDPQRPEVLAYANRVSDLLFLMARHENHKQGVEESNPRY
jgi:cob(I)alamin adenosyltransferase